MPEIEMPAGQYFSLSGMITAHRWRQTRALLMRNRLLAQRAGIEPILLTFDARPHYPQTRAGLREQGQLVDPMRLLNIFEWYRDNDIDHAAAIGDPLPRLEGFATEDDHHPDGTVYRTHYLHRSSLEDIAHDYRRPDGSVYLRMPVGARAATPGYRSHPGEQPRPAGRALAESSAGGASSGSSPSPTRRRARVHHQRQPLSRWPTSCRCPTSGSTSCT